MIVFYFTPTIYNISDIDESDIFYNILNENNELIVIN